MELVQAMPEKWTPATKDGEPIRSTYELPFEYHLEDENGNSPSFTKTNKGIHIVIIGRSDVNKKKEPIKTNSKAEIRFEKIDKNGVSHYRKVTEDANQSINPIVKDQSINGEPIYKIADENPRFPGCGTANEYNVDLKKCGDKKMLQFVYSNIKYPATARAQGIEGTVVVRFIVQKDGSISDGKILRNIGGGTGEEALRVINLMKEKDIKWIPGLKDGHPVNFNFNLPVKFRLEKSDAKNEVQQKGKEIRLEKIDENGVAHYRTINDNTTNTSINKVASDKTINGAPIYHVCLLYTSPSPRDQRGSRMPSSA